MELVAAMDLADESNQLTTTTTNSTSHITPASTKTTFTSLYPAIVQCFTIILLGYITGRGGWINKSHAKGLNTFTTKFALPALLFSSMATLDWSKVEWSFLWAIFISKAILFILVLLVTLLLKRPSNLGLAALNGIFVTQSNDFALGYPIVKAIYGDTQPQFVQYIYLIAPISLLILNPIGFILLELHKASSESGTRSKLQLLLNVLKEIVTNPIIVMTALGVIANFIFTHKLPLLIDDLLTTLGDAFGACALFIIGLGIVGKFNKTMTPLLMGSAMLIFVKLLLFPMIAMAITGALNCGSSTNSTAQYSMFAFLYGTFPTAPSVYIYATHYTVGTDLIATSLVLGTVISAPLMFTSAMMVGMQILSMNAPLILRETSFDVAVLALICSAALILLFIVTKRSTRMPHTMVLVISLFQLLIAVGSIIDTSVKSSAGDSHAWWNYLKFILHCLGILGVSTMTSVIAITIYYMSCHSLCRALTLLPRLLCYGLGAPILLVCAILGIGQLVEEPSQSLIMFGNTETGIVGGVLIVNILITIFILILRHRKSHSASSISSDTLKTGGACAQGACSYTRNQSCDESSACASSLASSSSSLVNSTNAPRCYGSCNSNLPAATDRSLCSEREDKTALLSAVNIEDIVPGPSAPLNHNGDERLCTSDSKCSAERVKRCRGLLKTYDKANEDGEVSDGHQLGRVLVLLVILLLCQITISLYYIWKMALPGMTLTALSVELEFICIVFTTGQGLVTFITFGLDSENVLVPMKKFFSRIICRGKSEESKCSPSPEEQETCRQFVEHHLAHCKQSLPRIHSSKQNCFSGKALLSWLVDAGLAADSNEGQVYAESLIRGNIIKACSKSNSSFFGTKRHMYGFGNTQAAV